MTNKHGFYITKLKVTGINKRPAMLTFYPGFNLITGLSDTGKSFAFSCLNYMLGKKEAPKSIPESNGYVNIFLEIKTYNNKTYSLLRKLNGGDYSIKECKIDDFANSKEILRTLKVQPSEKDDNISNFLLQLSGFQNIKLRKSKNEITNLTFNYIRKLTTIAEDRIITEESPFYPTGQYAERTIYQNLLFYLLTKIDASELEIIENEDIRKSRINGKIEFAKNRIQILTQEIDDVKNNANSLNLKDIESEINNLKRIYNKINDEIRILNEKKRDTINNINTVKSKIVFIKEILLRLELLSKHYHSDLERLRACLKI